MYLCMFLLQFSTILLLLITAEICVVIIAAIYHAKVSCLSVGFYLVKPESKLLLRKPIVRYSCRPLSEIAMDSLLTMNILDVKCSLVWNMFS